MPKIRNKSGEDRFVPRFGVVEADGILEVSEDAVEGFCCQPIWDAEDAATQKVYDKAVRARRAAKKAEADQRAKDEAAAVEEPSEAAEGGE